MDRTAAPAPAATGPDPRRPTSGVLLALRGFFLFATSDAVVKVLTARYSVLQLIPVHVAFAALPLLVSTVRAGDLGVLRPRHLGLVALRGLPAGAGTAPNFYAFSTLPLVRRLRDHLRRAAGSRGAGDAAAPDRGPGVGRGGARRGRAAEAGRAPREGGLRRGPARAQPPGRSATARRAGGRGSRPG